MASVDFVAQLDFFAGLPAWALERVAATATERALEPNAFVLHQHDKAESLFILIDGEVQILLRFEGIDDLLVGATHQPGAVLGWSVFRIPHRYTASVRCDGRVRVIEVPASTLHELIETDPRVGLTILRRLASAVASRLERTRDLLADHSEGSSRS
jgi:CRP-like cAMP-binding protein